MTRLGEPNDAIHAAVRAILGGEIPFVVVYQQAGRDTPSLTGTSEQGVGTLELLLSGVEKLATHMKDGN